MDSEYIKRDEGALEALVSRSIGMMPFLWVGVGGEAGIHSERALLERNAIALLSSQVGATLLDPPSTAWLGHYSDREPVRQFGLWNQQHVGKKYDPSFLDLLGKRINA